MRSGIFYCFGAGIFLVTAVYARAAQAKPSTSTAAEPTVARGPRTLGQDAQERPELHRRNPRYQLCKDDVLQLNFALTPEFNQTLTVQPDGYITLLGVGDLHVEGQTVPDVTESIRAAYAKTLHNPIITVRLAGRHDIDTSSSHRGRFHRKLETLTGLAFPPCFERLGGNKAVRPEENVQERQFA